MGFPDTLVGKESACKAGDTGSIPGLGRSPGEGIDYPLHCFGASLVAQLVKNPPAMWETWVWSLGWEYPLEKGKATHSSILAWRIPQTVQSMGLQRVRHNLVTFTSLPVLSFSRVPSTSEARSYSSGSIPWPQPKQSGGVIPNLFFFFFKFACTWS